MVVKTTTLDDVVAVARQLSARDKLRLIEHLAAELGPIVPADPASETAPVAPPSGGAASVAPPAEAETEPNQAPQAKSLYGILAGMEPVPSEEDIAEMRREAWKNFPREHFFAEDE